MLSNLITRCPQCLLLVIDYTHMNNACFSVKYHTHVTNVLCLATDCTHMSNVFWSVTDCTHMNDVLCSVTRCTHTVYPKKYAHGFCFAVLCCGYTLTDFPISIRLTSLALRQSNDCPSASKATLMNMDKCFMWIHYERLHNHNKAKHNKTVCIFLGIYCMNNAFCVVKDLYIWIMYPAQ